MKRIHRLLILYFLYVAAWAFVFFDYSDKYFAIDPVVEKYIDASPALIVLSVGIYAVLSVIIGVLTFKDAGDAALKLSEDIKQAKLGLAKKGFTF